MSAMPEQINGFKLATIGNAFSNKQLELIILPTEKCNFRCTYCYEDFAIGKMKPAVIDGIKHFLASRIPNLDKLRLSWFGGEPLLAKDVILNIASFAKQLCDSNKVSFSGGFTTNAYLLSVDLLGQFAELNHLDYQITLDGDRDAHNSTRVLANGRGTYDTIWHNLISAAQSTHNFHITLRVHVTPNNADAIERLLGEIEGHIGADKRFSIFFHQVSNLGGPNRDNIAALSKAQYSEIVDRLKSASSLFSRKASSERDLASNGYICYAAKPNSFLIRADGRIGKCTVALDDDRNDIGTITNDGRLNIKNDKLRRWMSGFEEMDASMLGCPLSMLGKSQSKILPRANAIDAVVVTT